MSRSGAFIARIPDTCGAVRSARHRMVLLLAITAVALAGCGAPGLASLEDESYRPSAVNTETVTGCPTPVPADDLGLEQNAGMAGQSAQGPAILEDAMPTDQEAVPSLAEREAMLDRVNQGPTRPEERPEGDGVPPVPGIELQAGRADSDATVPLSGTSGLEADAATATPCP